MNSLLLWVALLAPQEVSVPAILEEACVQCHSPGKKKGGLDLTTREALLKGGDSGPAIVPGKGKQSLLYRLVARLDEPFMPQKSGKLAADRTAAIAAWIDAGAAYDRPLVDRGVPEVHWAFRPLRRPDAASIDALLPGKERASRETLIRRLTFDLTGLPPSPLDVDAFVHDAAPNAVEKLVDRLLASPHYGERWARHWLDVARYADSEGYRYDRDRKHAWPYRDFVIRAMNDDLPYDTFVRWQLAGDEIEPSNPQAVIATGFCTAGPLQEKQASDSKKNQERNRYDELDDMLATTGSAFLGLTLGCARCHDHKFDPIPTRDYYRMLAAFAGTKRVDRFLAPQAEINAFKAKDAEFTKRAGPLQAKIASLESRVRPALVRKKIDALPIREEDRDLLRAPVDKSNQRQEELLAVHQRELAVSNDELRDAMGGDDRAAWEAASAELLSVARPVPPLQAHTLDDLGAKPVKAWLLHRGEVDQKAEEVTLGFLGALGNPEPAAIRKVAGHDTSFQRTALASWITDVDRGAGRLLARVLVNRLWQHHFGEGLVRTPNDFGAQGDLPTHPELLDWLATELIARGWKLKAMHKLIVTSGAYLQVRRPVRLEAEALRDAILSVSGCLNAEMYGPGVKVPIPAELIITRTAGEHHYPRDVADGPAVWRRSVYTFIKRSVPSPMTDLFDTPSASASCGKRIPTTVAPQALLLLNDPFVRARAKDFAKRLAKEVSTPEEQVERAWRLAVGRTPTGTERNEALLFLAGQRERRRGDAAAALADFCQVLFGLNEFIYVD